MKFVSLTYGLQKAVLIFLLDAIRPMIRKAKVANRRFGYDLRKLFQVNNELDLILSARVGIYDKGIGLVGVRFHVSVKINFEPEGQEAIFRPSHFIDTTKVIKRDSFIDEHGGFVGVNLVEHFRPPSLSRYARSFLNSLLAESIAPVIPG
jgi:hypothetical protein